MFWIAGCSVMKTWIFFCSLDVLYGGIINTVQFWIKRLWLYNFWSSNPCIRKQNQILHQIRILKCWIRIETSADLRQVLLFQYNIWGIIHLLLGGCVEGCFLKWKHPLLWSCCVFRWGLSECREVVLSPTGLEAMSVALIAWCQRRLGIFIQTGHIHKAWWWGHRITVIWGEFCMHNPN